MEGCARRATAWRAARFFFGLVLARPLLPAVGLPPSSPARSGSALPTVAAFARPLLPTVGLPPSLFLPLARRLWGVGCVLARALRFSARNYLLWWGLLRGFASRFRASLSAALARGCRVAGAARGKGREGCARKISPNPPYARAGVASRLRWLGLRPALYPSLACAIPQPSRPQRPKGRWGERFSPKGSSVFVGWRTELAHNVCRGLRAVFRWYGRAVASAPRTSWFGFYLGVLPHLILL